MKIVYQQHISWFETEMALETLESMIEASQYTSLPIEVHLCCNLQTYLEEPLEGTPQDMFKCITEHPQFSQWQVVWKSNEDPFYNVGDWRRDCYDGTFPTVWGESDCLVPALYFAYIESIQKQLTTGTPYFVTVQQKKMWDSSWTPTEHTALQNFTLEQVRVINNKLVTGEGVLTLRELNEYNEAFEQQLKVSKSTYYKGDGALVCLGPNMPTPFIAEGLHMCGEDTYFYNYCSKKRVDMYMIEGLLKGHNTAHPKKRMNYSTTSLHKERFTLLDQQMRMLAHTSLNSL
jgi:hypothetical protein